MAKKKAPGRQPTTAEAHPEIQPDVEGIIKDTARSAHEEHADAATRGVNVLGAFETADKVEALLRKFYLSLVSAGWVKQ